MPEPHSFQKLRPCGRLERFSTARHHLGFYNNVAVSATYSTPDPHSSLHSLIYRALALVISQHSILSAILVDEDKSDPYFARLPQIDLDQCTTFVTRQSPLSFNSEKGGEDLELDDLLSKQHNRNFKDRYGELPFWRVLILHNGDAETREFVLSFIYHHALADGTSGLAFHRSFLSSVNIVSSQSPTSISPDETIITSPSTPLLPPLEALHPLPLSLSYLLKALINKSLGKPPATLWTGKPITVDPSHKSRFQSFSLSASHTKALLALSRNHKTTLTGALEALVAASTFANLGKEYERLGVDVAVSLRRFLDKDVVNADVIGDFVSKCVFKHNRAAPAASSGKNSLDLFSWNEARKIRGTIEEELGKNGKDTVVGLLPYAGDMHKFFTDNVGKRRDASFEFSNIGVFKAAQTRGEDGSEDAEGDAKVRWKIGRCFFSQGVNVCGAAFEVSVVTGGDGCLTMGFSWIEGVVEGEWMDKVVQDLKSGIEVLLREAEGLEY